MIISVTTPEHAGAEFEAWVRSFGDIERWDYDVGSADPEKDQVQEFMNWIGLKCEGLSSEKVRVLKVFHKWNSLLFVLSMQDLFEILNAVANEEVRFILFIE